ncbi:hypothetical protein TSUD_272950 [Trifolium subterraneum]|uniref:Uncharacterized protein n=1 Tax=Trifolium subterraneum TaxID=3900 RepID=A0A2Z6PIT6_TRISU|nr:hypothetical protein TSUD_272950 [Trifolium subterraneum]
MKPLIISQNSQTIWGIGADVQNSYGPLRVVVLEKSTKTHNEEDDDVESDDELEDASTLRQHDGICGEEVDEHSTHINVNDDVADFQEVKEKETTSLALESENDLALIVFNSNSNLDDGGSTNNVMGDNIQEEMSVDSVDCMKQINNTTKADHGHKIIGLSKSGRGLGGVNNNGKSKQDAGHIQSNGLKKLKEGNMTKPKVKSMQNILCEGSIIAPGGKLPPKRNFSKVIPSRKSNNDLAKLVSVINQRGGAPSNQNNSHEKSSQSSSRYSGVSVLFCSSIKSVDITQLIATRKFGSDMKQK